MPALQSPLPFLSNLLNSRLAAAASRKPSRWLSGAPPLLRIPWRLVKASPTVFLPAPTAVPVHSSAETWCQFRAVIVGPPGAVDRLELHQRSILRLRYRVHGKTSSSLSVSPARVSADLLDRDR